jgi:hypothetical protein
MTKLQCKSKLMWQRYIIKIISVSIFSSKSFRISDDSCKIHYTNRRLKTCNVILTSESHNVDWYVIYIWKKGKEKRTLQHICESWCNILTGAETKQSGHLVSYSRKKRKKNPFIKCKIKKRTQKNKEPCSTNIDLLGVKIWRDHCVSHFLYQN